jgi:hypothetical protein
MFRKALPMVAIAGLCALASPAHAASTTQPGETVGIASGAPLPPGVYFINTLSWGERNDTDLIVTIPVVAWSTPWHLLGARLQLLGATPYVWTDDDDGWYNILGAAQLAWDLGGGWGVSYLAGAYTNSPSDLGVDSASFNQRFAISYTADGWNLTANVINGIYTNDDVADYINLDLTAVKTFGKWQLGVVAFGGWDLEDVFGVQEERFAIGGLVGYDFDRFTLQAYVTQEVMEEDLGEKETRVWGRLVVPLRKDEPMVEPVADTYPPLK